MTKDNNVSTPLSSSFVSLSVFFIFIYITIFIKKLIKI